MVSERMVVPSWGVAMKTIITKDLGSHVMALDASNEFKCATYPVYGKAATQRTHDAATITLCQQLGWTGKLLRNGTTYLLIDELDIVDIPIVERRPILEGALKPEVKHLPRPLAVGEQVYIKNKFAPELHAYDMGTVLDPVKTPFPNAAIVVELLISVLTFNKDGECLGMYSKWPDEHTLYSIDWMPFKERQELLEQNRRL
jgi:hypothetical protein